MDKNTINARFIKAINALLDKHNTLSKGDLASALSIKPAKFSEILNGRMNVGSELLADLSKKFDISSEWLLNGDGEVFKNSSLNTSNPNSLQEVETRPRIPFEAAAGSLSLITQSVTESQCEQIPIRSGLPAYDFSIIVKGDSMEPEFHSGDELACKILRQSSFIQWGRPYIVDCMDGVVLKRIHDAGDDILCTSDNKNYGDFKIPKREINHLAIVVGMIRLF